MLMKGGVKEQAHAAGPRASGPEYCNTETRIPAIYKQCQCQGDECNNRDGREGKLCRVLREQHSDSPF